MPQTTSGKPEKAVINSAPDIAGLMADARLRGTDTLRELHGIVIRPEMDEEHPRLLVEHVAVDRGDLDIAGA